MGRSKVSQRDGASSSERCTRLRKLVNQLICRRLPGPLAHSGQVNYQHFSHPSARGDSQHHKRAILTGISSLRVINGMKATVCVGTLMLGLARGEQRRGWLFDPRGEEMPQRREWQDLLRLSSYWVPKRELLGSAICRIIFTPLWTGQTVTSKQTHEHPRPVIRFSAPSNSCFYAEIAIRRIQAKGIGVTGWSRARGRRIREPGAALLTHSHDIRLLE